MSQYPGLYTVNVFKQMSLVIELMTSHVKRNDSSQRVRFSNKLSQAVPDSDHKEIGKKASFPPISGVSPVAQLHVLSPTKGLKFNQKRRGAWPVPRDVGQRSEEDFHVLKGLRVQTQRMDLTRKFPSAL